MAVTLLVAAGACSKSGDHDKARPAAKDPEINPTLDAAAAKPPTEAPDTGDADDRLTEILRGADPDDRAQLEAALAKVDAIIAEGMPTAFAHHARGQLLSALGRKEDALAAYRAATAIDPKLGDAHYNAGTILAEAGKVEEAIAEWDAAAVADPKNIDAYYNAAQAHYNRGEFEKALEKWQAAGRLAPEDFDILKKVLQSQNALGRFADADHTHEALLALWKASKDPAVQGMTEYVCDQLVVEGKKVMVLETLKPTTDDLWYVYTFRVDEGDHALLTVQLETSAYGRETGTPYLFGVTDGQGHHAVGQPLKELPKYADVKTQAVEIIQQELSAKP